MGYINAPKCRSFCEIYVNNTIKPSYNVMKCTEYFFSFYTNIILSEDC